MPEKDKNTQEGPDIRSNLIKVNMGGGYHVCGS